MHFEGGKLTNVLMLLKIVSILGNNLKQQNITYILIGTAFNANKIYVNIINANARKKYIWLILH